MAIGHVGIDSTSKPSRCFRKDVLFNYLYRQFEIEDWKSCWVNGSSNLQKLDHGHLNVNRGICGFWVFLVFVLNIWRQITSSYNNERVNLLHAVLHKKRLNHPKKSRKHESPQEISSTCFYSSGTILPHK